jgi:hypothetical protein
MHLIINVVVFMFLLPEYANTLGISAVALEGLFAVAGAGICTLQQFCKISNINLPYPRYQWSIVPFLLMAAEYVFLVQNFYISVASISKIAIREKLNRTERDTMR